jgi:hypothetical protein
VGGRFAAASDLSADPKVLHQSHHPEAQNNGYHRLSRPHECVDCHIAFDAPGKSVEYELQVWHLLGSGMAHDLSVEAHSSEFISPFFLGQDHIEGSEWTTYGALDTSHQDETRDSLKGVSLKGTE